MIFLPCCALRLARKEEKSSLCLPLSRSLSSFGSSHLCRPWRAATTKFHSSSHSLAHFVSRRKNSRAHTAHKIYTASRRFSGSHAVRARDHADNNKILRCWIKIELRAISRVTRVRERCLFRAHHLNSFSARIRRQHAHSSPWLTESF